MCCSLEPAHFSSTTIYVGEATHPTRDVLVHVLGYQNTAENLSRGPNAMVLPFPAAEPMTPENVLSTKENSADLKRAFEKYRAVVNPVERGMKSMPRSNAAAAAAPVVQVFDAGDYTVVMAKSDNVVEVHKALAQVPEARRPKLDRHYLVAYRKLYPDWTIALCCFDGRIKADPMLWWYSPRDPSRFFVPTLDAHDGKPPRADDLVHLDHTLVFGSTIKPRGEFIFGRLHDDLRPWLADQVVGQTYTPEDGWAANGDFVLPWSWESTRGRYFGSRDWRPLRVPPPGA